MMDARARSPCLYYDRLGRPILEDADGTRWFVRAESVPLVLLAESGERLQAPLPSAWEHLGAEQHPSAEDLEVPRRSARPLDPGEHTSG